MQRSELKGTQRLAFDGLNNQPVTGWRWPPPGGLQSRMNSILQTTVDKVTVLDNATTTVRRNPNLSPSGRVQAVAPHRAAAIQATADALASVGKERQRIADARAKLFAPPTLDAGDAANAQLDGEIRARVAGLSQNELDGLHAAMGAGKQDRVQTALARDPFDNAEATFARALLAKRVEQKNPDQIAALNVAEEDADWAGSAIEGLKVVLARSDGFGIEGIAQRAA